MFVILLLMRFYKMCGHQSSIHFQIPVRIPSESGVLNSGEGVEKAKCSQALPKSQLRFILILPFKKHLLFANI